MNKILIALVVILAVAGSGFAEEKLSATTTTSKGKAISQKQMNAIINLRIEALKEAKLVNVVQVNSVCPDFGLHFKDEYIKGLEQFIESYEKMDYKNISKAQALLDNWGDWYLKNRKKIKLKKTSENAVHFIKSIESSNESSKITDDGQFFSVVEEKLFFK